MPAANHPRPRPRGYTFIELLLVITLIGILVALLLPAVQAAREAARRIACSRNISQLILAVQQYENAFGVYPPGTVNSERPIRNLPVGYHHNWISQVLPYLEQRNAYRAIDRRLGVYHPQHYPVRTLDLQSLNCPSMGIVGDGYSDYAGVHHHTEAPIDIDNTGVFFLNSRIGYEDVVDGLSNTLFVGEKLSLRGDLGWMSGTRATLRNGGSAIRSRLGATPMGLPHDLPDAFEEPMVGEELLSVLLSAFQGPVPALVDPDLAVGGFGSVHPGGGQFALGDGSIRFLSQNIDPRAYGQLSHRADRQLAEEF